MHVEDQFNAVDRYSGSAHHRENTMKLPGSMFPPLQSWVYNHTLLLAIRRFCIAVTLSFISGAHLPILEWSKLSSLIILIVSASQGIQRKIQKPTS